MRKIIKLFPADERGAEKSIVWGFFLMLAGVAALYWGNVLADGVFQGMGGRNLGSQLLGALLVIFVHGTQILLLFLAWISVGEGISRSFGRFELAAELLVSSLGVWVTWLVFPLLSARLCYSFSVNFYMCLLLAALFQVLTLHVDNWLAKSAAMMLWVYSFQSLELLPARLANGQTAFMEEAAIASMAGFSLFLSFIAGAVISTWVLVSYSVRLNQARRLWSGRQDGGDEDEGLLQVSMVDIRNLVHDLKNPLAAIKGLAFSLHGSPDSPGGSKKVEIMLRATDYMERMIGEILHEDQLHEVQVEPFFDRLENHVHSFPWGGDVKISIASDAGQETVAVNEIRFTRALLNLLDNARRANEMAGAEGIELRVRRNAQLIEVEILDNGPGVKGNPVHKTQPHPHQKSGWGSTGLGLAFARKVTAIHGGSLVLSQRTDAPGGASVLISLPIVPGGHKQNSSRVCSQIRQ